MSGDDDVVSTDPLVWSVITWRKVARLAVDFSSLLKLSPW